jgi:hypothetical protein
MGDSKDKVPHGDSIDSEEVKVPTGIDVKDDGKEKDWKEETLNPGTGK